MNEMLVVILGYCSLVSGQCGAVLTKPIDGNYTLEQCREDARKLTKNVEEQEEWLSQIPAPPPHKTAVRCGTMRQVEEIITSLGEEGE